MGTQNDSIDISQLQAFALGLDNDLVSKPMHSNACHLGYASKLTPSSLSSHKRDPSPVAAASKHQHRQVGQDLTKSACAEKDSIHRTNPPPQNLTQSQQWSASQPQSRRLDSRDKGPRLSASQPELPSTIPESSRNKMLLYGSQSQGDTQPVSQWVYEQFTNKAREQPAIKETLGQDGTNSHTVKATVNSIQPGETGHVDLLGAFEEPSIIDVGDFPTDQEGDDIDPLSQEMDVRADIFPESSRFQQPKTPATNAKKRKRGSDVNSQKMETPKLPTNPFAGQMGSIDGLMDPSQLFKATQALTSPLLITSDGLSERPSPDIHNIQRPSTADSLSSPVRMPRAGMVRAVTEPQTTYISMQASQEAREKLLQAQKAEQVLSADELSDDGFASEDTQIRRHLNQRKIEIEARNQFAGLTARSEPTVRARGRRLGGRTKNIPSRVSPRGAGREAREPVLISDDGPGDEEQGNITEDETECEEKAELEPDDDADELGEENKENVEVPRTVSRAQHAVSQVIASQPSPSHQLSRKPKVISQTKSALPISSSSRVTRSQEATKTIQTATQPEAIADSQPSQSRAKQNAGRYEFRASSEPRSSIDTRILVPHSQSSDGSKAARMSSSTSKASLANAYSQNPPNTSSNRMNSQQKVAVAESATQIRGAFAREGAAVEPPQQDGSKASALGSRGADCVHPPSTESHSNAAQSSELSTSHLVPPQNTIPDTTSVTAHHHHNTRGSTVDSSNSILSPRNTPKSASKQPSCYSVVEQSHPSTLFETAQEQLPETPSKTQVQKMRQKPQSKQASPIRFKRPRSIGEIAADPSPPDPLGDVDIDIDILSNEDIEFQKALGGSSPVLPARKRRRGGRELALQVAELDPKSLPPLLGTPLPPGSSAISWPTPVQTSSDAETRSPVTRRTHALQIDQEAASPLRTSEKTVQEAFLDEKATSVPAPVLKPATKLSRKLQPETNRSLEMPIPTSSEDPLARRDNSGDVRQPTVTAPNRVFALFSGTNPAYHPATCLEVKGGDKSRYTVRFDDGTIDTISAYGIKRLQLRAGDLVKVDLPGARIKSYVIEGMRDQHRPATPPDPATPSRRGQAPSTNDAAFPETDVHGYATVLLTPKQRPSIGGNPSDNEQLAVPLTQIYFTQTLWATFRNRIYTHTLNRLQTSTGLQTPSERPSTPSTPSSRTRRVKTSGLAMSRSMKSSTITRDGLFKNMAFAITNIGRTEDSELVKNKISSNGGIVLDNGFDELFHIPPLPRTTSPKDEDETTFQLTSAAEDVGFTCLIADKHCRRAKFIQALALGIPCLATRWITDCVTKERVLPWTPYLLPAGDSAYLGGVVRSRVLQPFSADTATISSIVESRPKMLDGASVLLIMEKGQEETMKQHPLITHALGASRVARAISQEAAAKAVNDAQALGEPWNWVFSYDKEEQVEKRLSGGGQTGKKRKRGRESEAYEGVKRVRGGTKVVGNEFVIQSLILGMLVEE
jgi:hypothetical protein